jgi:tetratricopeptide (TPR) repeat protein
MYKRRIKDWRVMKYYKREEKEAVCHALKRRGLAGKDRHQIMIRNQPAKVYRILRHIKSSGGQMDGPVSGCPRTSADEEEVEVCTPGGGTTFDDEASLCSAARHLLSGSRASPSPGRPILTNDDLGKAEIICLEVSRYFEILLPSYALTRQGQLSAKYHIPVNTFNHVSIVSSLVLTRRYAEARLYLSKAFDLLKGMLHEQSPKLLPTLLGTGLVFEDERTPFKVGDSFFKHTADLCEICLGVQHPITVVLRLYRGVVCKNQVANAALGRLLENTTRSAEYGESHDLSIYLVRLKCDALMRLGFFEEAEKTVKLAVASCKSLHGTSHELTIQLFGTLAVVGMSGLYDYSRAKALYQNLLHSLEHANDVWSLCGTLTALRGLGRIAYIEFNFQEAEGLFRKALDLAGIIFNDGAPETTHVACDFAYLSRLAEKIWKQTFCSTLSSEY